MKKDKLEQFIRDNREEFDNESPSPEIWYAIEQKLPKETPIRSIHWKSMLRIAAVFLLGAMSWAMVDYFLNRTESNSKQTISYVPIIKTNITNDYRAKQIIKDNTVKPEIKRNIPSEKSLAQLTAPKNKKESDLTSYQNELGEMQAYYASQISEKRSKIMQFSTKQPEIGKEIDIEFLQIDSIYTVMLNDLKDNINNQEVIEAMIMNYRARLEVLDMMLQQLTEKYASL